MLYCADEIFVLWTGWETQLKFLSTKWKPVKLMMMMMNCFCGMVDRRKAFSLISSRDHCQRSSPSRISDMPREGFEPVQNLSLGLVEWSCAAVITTTPRRQAEHAKIQGRGFQVKQRVWTNIFTLYYKSCSFLKLRLY